MVSPSWLQVVATTLALILGSSLAEEDDSVEPQMTDFDEWVAPKLGINVTENESLVEEVWVRDVVWEAMVTTAWMDYITRLNREKALYGVTLEPLELALLTGQETLSLERSILGYEVSMSLRDLELEGLSGLSLNNLSLSRDRNLTSIFTEAVLDAPYLLLTGVYNMEGTAKKSLLSYLLPDISSEGEQAFSINITRARIRADLRVELVDGCAENGEVSPVITKIEFPFSYGDLQFKFDNLGSTVAAAVEGLGGWVIEYQRTLLVNLIRAYIGSEVASFVCSTYERVGVEGSMVDTEDWESPVWTDSRFKYLLHLEGKPLIRDRLAESTVSTIFEETILRHLTTRGSQLRTQLDPLPLFPIEFGFKKDVYSADVEACDAYVHNIKMAKFDSMFLARDPDLEYSALRVQFSLPITWVSGFYKLRNAYLFTFIPAGGSGDFNVDLKDVRVSLAVILRHTEELGLQMEHFRVDIGWQTIVFKFDGLWSGLEEIADKVMNQFGLGNVLVAKQKQYIMSEIKTYVRGLAVCMMWSPSQGIDLCMRDFWIGLGWEWPWVYPTCK